MVNVGHISARLDAIFDESGFTKFDRAHDRSQLNARKPVTAKLAGNYDPRALNAYDQALDRIRQSAKREADFKAKLGGDFDPRAFRAYEAQLRDVEQTTDRSVHAQGRLKTAFGSVYGQGGAAFAAAGGLYGLQAAGKAVIGTATDINESVSKNSVLFGRYALDVDAFSKTTASGFGISRKAALEATGTFGNLFVALDIGPKKAANMSVELTKLAADLASFNNASPEEALEAIRSGLVGETEPLRKFGVNLSDAALRSEALRQGLVKTTKDALTPQQKALAVNALLFKQTDKAQGDFARTSGGLANQQRILKARLSDTAGEIGEKLLPAATKGVRAINQFIGEMQAGTGAGGEFADTAQDVGHAIAGTAKLIKNHAGLVKLAAEAWVAYKLAAVAGIAASKGGVAAALLRGAPAAPAAASGAAAAGSAAGGSLVKGLLTRAGALGVGVLAIETVTSSLKQASQRPSAVGKIAAVGDTLMNKLTLGWAPSAEENSRKAFDRAVRTMRAYGARGLGRISNLELTVDQRKTLASLGRAQDAANRLIKSHALPKFEVRVGAKEADIRTLERNFNRLKNDLAGDFDGIERNSKQAMRAIAKTMGTESDAGRAAVVKNTSLTARAISTSMKDGETSTKKGFEGIRDVAVRNSKSVRSTTSSNFAAAATAIEGAAQKGLITSRQKLAQLRKLWTAELEIYGVTPAQARNIAKGNGDGGRYGDPDNNQGREGGALRARGGRIPYAAGGWIGAPGQIGQDSVAIDAPVGGSVINRHQLPYADLALAATGGIAGLLARGKRSSTGATSPIIAAPGELMLDPDQTHTLDRAMGAMGGLDALFATVRTPHWMARGGIVPVPGFPGELAAASILDEIKAVSGRFGLILTDAYGPGHGHKSPGHNVTGTAADFAGPDAAMDRAVKYLVGKGYLVGYDGRYGSKDWPGHGPSAGQGGSNAHLHVEFGGRGGGKLTGGAGAGAGATVLKRLKVGLPGAVGAVAQRAVDTARGAANRSLEAVGGQDPAHGVSPEANAKGAAGALSRAQVLSLAGRALAYTRLFPNTAGNRNKLDGRAVFESGRRPRVIQQIHDVNSGGNEAGGLMQIIPGTFAANRDPRLPNDRFNAFANMVASIRYMKARYGRIMGYTGVGYSRGGTIAGLPRFGPGGRTGSPFNVRSIQKALGTSPAAGDGKGPKMSSRMLRGKQTDRIAAYEDLRGGVEDLERRYGQQDRRYGMSEEVLVDETTGEINSKAIGRRLVELWSLMELRKKIARRLEEARTVARRVVKTYGTLISRLRASLKHTKGKDRSGIRSSIADYTEKLQEWEGNAKDVSFDLTDARLDVRDIRNEMLSVKGTKATPPAASNDDKDPDPPPDAPPDPPPFQAPDSDPPPAEPVATPPTPAEIAASALAALATFQSARADLFGSFGANAVANGPLTGVGAQAAGTRYFGGETGGTNGGTLAGAGGIVQHITFTGPAPADPHTFTQAALHELRAAV